MSRNKNVRGLAFGLAAAVCLLALGAGVGAQMMTAPKYKADADWPKPLPNKWKMGGVTGLAVDKDDNVWVLDRPNDLTNIELEAELNPPIADCCTRPPSMIHIDKAGDVIGSFDPPQGHGMTVDKEGFAYIGNTVDGIGNVRKYDPKTGKMVGRIAAHAGDAAGRRGTRCRSPRPRVPGQGSMGPVFGFLPGARKPSRSGHARSARSGDRGVSRQVSPDHTDDRGRNRGGSPGRTRA